MSKIIIYASTSDVAELSAISLLEEYFIAKTARISYNFNEGLPHPQDVEKYPLILEGKVGNYSASVHVYAVTAGYGGTGPHAMVNILEKAGFTFDESEILTKKCADSTGQITLTYFR